MALSTHQAQTPEHHLGTLSDPRVLSPLVLDVTIGLMMLFLIVVSVTILSVVRCIACACLTGVQPANRPANTLADGCSPKRPSGT